MYYKALALNFTELHNYKQPEGAEGALSFQLLLTIATAAPAAQQAA